MCLNGSSTTVSKEPVATHNAPKLHIACKTADMFSRCFRHHFLLQGSTAWHSTDHLSGIFLLRGVSITRCRGLVCQHVCCRSTSLPILLNHILSAKQQSLWQLAALYMSLCILSVLLLSVLRKHPQRKRQHCGLILRRKRIWAFDVVLGYEASMHDVSLDHTNRHNTAFCSQAIYLR